ncbi:MAG TPA: ABC transporter ATP-binding protein [Anaerolineae bacterium]
MDEVTILASGLTKRYGSLLAVDRLDLEVHAGEIFGFLGPNGAGKSTTIRMLIGLLQPTAGTALVAGHDVVTDPLEVKRNIGYLAEHAFLYDKLTGREFLRFIAGLYRVPRSRLEARIDRLLELFDLKEKGDELIESYSKGMRQKVGIASLLVHQPRVLFLDEPTNGLDPKSARLIKDVLRQLCGQGATIFMSTHVLEIAETMCDRVAIINEGRLVAQGTLAELRGRAPAPGSSLEDIFLQLTGGAEVAELAALLSD